MHIGRAGHDLANLEDLVAHMPRTGRRDAAQLQQKHFPEIPFIVPRYVAPGLTLLAAKPKIGKSWVCLDIAISVATGRYCLGDVKCNSGQVLFIALEDNERRLHCRLTKLLPSGAWPADLDYATDWRRAGHLAAVQCPVFLRIDVGDCSHKGSPNSPLVDLCAATLHRAS
jgi:hypothetical protein